ncbi:HD domain-containing protein [Ulvibacter antarcticus]|uniref:HD domain-containing protein n=1 Tax=Ulvibacter antarcticus TaxID=442714 RepID=A0A3L9Z1K9_9FLAO|nr:HD domain-containing protein [Ulvibacter antarcticus]RMA65897.1 uncharacterized protein BXY75_0313 [Ulvibacter antarcticus]
MFSEKDQEIVDNTIQFVKDELKNAEGGHDWFHIERVYKNAMLIASEMPSEAQEKIDFLIVALGALLHDIADSKFHKGDETVGPKKAAQFLKNEDISEEKTQHIVKIIENISFKGGNREQSFKSVMLDIVQDADRLDALGAIGIARTFNYGGFKNRTLYNPDIKPDLNMSPETYKASEAPTINHFYEKLLLLKDRMNTEAGKKIAMERHRFMETYLKQFYAEWDGKL